MSTNWVLIRGIVSESYHWASFLPHFQQGFSQHKVHTVDICGNGPFCKQRTPLSIGQNVNYLRSQIAQTENSGKILFGFSLGGMLALDWANSHPEEVKGLVLVNSSLSNSASYKRMQPKTLLKIAKTALVSNPYEKEKAVLSFTTSSLDQERKHDLAQDWGKRNQQHPISIQNFLRQLWIAKQARLEKYKNLQMPILVLSSAKDQVVSPECSELIAQSFRVKNIQHPSAGHDLTLEDPAWVTEQVRTWYEKSVSLPTSEKIDLYSQHTV